MIFQDWGPREAALFGHQPLRLAHNLHQNPLFDREALADLIEVYKKTGAAYTLVQMGPQGSPKKEWLTGRIGTMSGREVIDKIEHNRLWINLLHVNEVSEAHGRLLADIYQEIASNVPGHPPTYKRISGILISSPRAQVYYHFDTAGQNLWQISGSKRVWLYPAAPPFLRAEELEDVTLHHNEVGIHFEPWYDEYARVFDLAPGEMLHWPLNAPHRIENDDALSVSYTTEFFTREIQKHYRVTQGNGVLRSLGVQPAQHLGPASVAAKTALALSYRLTKRAKPTPKADPAFVL